MKAFAALFMVVATLGYSSVASAWGAKEQGAVAGVLGTLLVQKAYNYYESQNGDLSDSNSPSEAQRHYYTKPATPPSVNVTVINQMPQQSYQYDYSE